MDEVAPAKQLENSPFDKISWIYLESNGDYSNQIATDRKKIVWIPSRGSSAIARKTGWGDGLDLARHILVDLDSSLLGIYKILTPVREGDNVILQMWLDLKDKQVRRPRGNSSGCYLSKHELLALILA